MLRETRTERSVEELRNVIIIPGGDTNKRKQKVKEITECDPRFDSRSLILQGTCEETGGLVHANN